MMRSQLSLSVHRNLWKNLGEEGRRRVLRVGRLFLISGVPVSSGGAASRRRRRSTGVQPQAREARGCGGPGLLRVLFSPSAEGGVTP